MQCISSSDRDCRQCLCLKPGRGFLGDLQCGVSPIHSHSLRLSPCFSLPPVSRKIHSQHRTSHHKQLWALDSLWQIIQFKSFRSCQLSHRQCTQNHSPEIALGLPVCRVGKRKWKITMSLAAGAVTFTAWAWICSAGISQDHPFHAVSRCLAISYAPPLAPCHCSVYWGRGKPQTTVTCSTSIKTQDLSDSWKASKGLMARRKGGVPSGHSSLKPRDLLNNLPPRGCFLAGLSLIRL